MLRPEVPLDGARLCLDWKFANAASRRPRARCVNLERTRPAPRRCGIVVWSLAATDFAIVAVSVRCPLRRRSFGATGADAFGGGAARSPTAMLNTLFDAKSVTTADKALSS